MLSLFDIIFNFVEVAITVWFVTNYLTLKPSTKFWHVGILYAAIVTELMVSNWMVQYSTSLPLIQSITLMIFAFFFAKNHLIEKIAVSWLVMNLVTIVAVFTLLILGALYDMSIMDIVLPKGTEYKVAVVLSKVLYLAASIFLVRMRKTIKSTFLSSNWWQFALLMGLNLISLSILIGFLNVHAVNFTWLVVAILANIALIAAIYFLFIRIQVESKKRYEDMLLIKELSYQKKSFDDVMTISEELKKYRHDVNHVLTAAIGLAINKHSDDAIALLTKYQEEIAEVQDYITTSNVGLDYVLNTKIAHGSSQGIRFKTMYTVNNLTMPIDDLSILIGNALDNAIEHCGGENKEINIEFREVNEFISVKIVNSIDQSVLQQNPELATTKQQTSLHGYGVKSMRYIAKKYRGDVEYKEERGYFICNILFQN